MTQFETMIRDAESTIRSKMDKAVAMERVAETKVIKELQKSQACKEMEGFYCEAQVDKTIITGHRFEKINEDSQNIFKYYEDAKGLAGILNKNGISPMAILPKGIFLRLAKQCGLYGFGLTTSTAPFAFKIAMTRREVAGIVAGIMDAMARNPIKVQKDEDIREAIKDSFLKVLAETKQPIIQCENVDTGSRHGLDSFDALSPYGGHSNLIHYNYILLNVEFYRSQRDEMLDATLSILKDITKENNLSNIIVAEDSAIDISGLDFIKEYEDAKERREARERDPIICTAKGDAIAVLYQYGPFPAEQKFMSKVRFLKYSDMHSQVKYKRGVARLEGQEPINEPPSESEKEHPWSKVKGFFGYKYRGEA